MSDEGIVKPKHAQAAKTNETHSSVESDNTVTQQQQQLFFHKPASVAYEGRNRTLLFTNVRDPRTGGFVQTEKDVLQYVQPRQFRPQSSVNKRRAFVRDDVADRETYKNKVQENDEELVETAGAQFGASILAEVTDNTTDDDEADDMDDDKHDRTSKKKKKHRKESSDVKTETTPARHHADSDATTAANKMNKKKKKKSGLAALTENY